MQKSNFCKWIYPLVGAGLIGLKQLSFRFKQFSH